MSRPVRIVQVKANGEAPALTAKDLDLDDANEIPDNDGSAEETSQDETDGGRKARGSGPKTDRNAGIALVHDLNFRPQGQPTLREFFAEKASRTDMEDILVAVYYMQHMMLVPKVGLG